MPAASLVVEVALGKGPNDTGLVDGDYTDLSDRVLGFSMDRGRDDRTQSFDPGTCTLILDNEDRELDPMRAGSTVDLDADLGLPLCPIRISVTYDGSDHRIFTGYIGPEPWRPLPNPVDGKPAVRLDAMDRLAYAASVGLPSSPFAAQVQWLAPDWWIRGLVADSITAGVADELKDASGNGYSGTVTTSVPGNIIYGIDSLVPGDDDSALTHEQGVSVYTDATALTASAANVTMGCIWRGTPHAVDQEIIRQRDMSGSVVRWRLHCTTAGDLVAIIYNSGGVATDFVAAPANPASGSGGRWDDDEPHLVFVRVEGGVRLRVYADGETAFTATSIPATVQGRVIFGGGNQLASFDEVMFWRRSIPLADLDRISESYTGVSPPFDDDPFEDRLERWWDLTNHPRGGSDLEAYPGPLSPSLAGVADMPSSLADAWEQTTGSFLGTLWVTRAGAVRATTADAAGAAVPEAVLSDDPDATDTVPIVRRTMPEFTGVRLDRVVNVNRFTIGGRTYEVRDDASIARYGERVRAYDIYAHTPTGQTPVLPSTDDLAAPTWEIEPVTVYPLIDPGAAEWVFTILELETWTEFQWVDGGYLNSTDLQVQSESWVWERDRLEVAVKLAPYGGVANVTSTPFAGETIVLGSEAGDVLTTETDLDLGAAT